MGSGKKGILWLPDLQWKGYIFIALGQAWLREDSSILSGETSLGRLGG